MFRRARRHAARAVLPAVTLLLLGSAALRLGEGSGFAMARDALATGMAATAQDDTLAAPAEDEEALGMLIARLRAREADVARREAALETRASALARIATEVDARLAELREAETALRATMALADTAAENDLLQLTTVYENMKPKEAAALFETMEPSFAAGFLARMKAPSAAAILSGLTPDTAYMISVILSGRNIEAPTD